MKFTNSDINPSNTWQIGTGDDTRMYHDIFLKYGVALVGPGEPGREGDNETALFYANNPNFRNWGAVLKQVKKNQWLIARKGKQNIVAIGQVTDEYGYSHLFDDVEGWDLQHFVKVKWYKPKTNEWLRLSGTPLSQSTLQGCHNNNVYSAIYATEFDAYPCEISPESLQQPAKLEITQIIDALINLGIRIQDAENIGNTLQRVIRLASWYIDYDNKALESEIVSFLILPFLIAIGWSEQKIKLEYNNIDIALFEKTFTGDYCTSPSLILEAKKFENGLSFTDAQIHTYASNFPECRKFIATNGFRYKFFEKENEELIPKGYFNLLNLKEKNVLDGMPLTTIETILKISNF